MRFLVTAGSTEVDIDTVRQMKTHDPDYDVSIGNGFKGATGESIARYLKRAGHDVTLLTSNRDFTNDDILRFQEFLQPRSVKLFRTYQELALLMADEVQNGGYDGIVHSAAVSDFYVSGVYALKDGALVALDQNTKISSDYDRLFFETKPTEKLIDKIRTEWGFKGKLVKFKLQTGKTDAELYKIAMRSLKQSDADWVVANCREWYKKRAYILGCEGTTWDSVTRNKLPEELCRRLVR